jgi:hypothetical protein
VSQIIAWKSDIDGKIFEDKTKYRQHLRKLAQHRLAQRKLAIKEAEVDAIWAELYEKEQSIEDWFQMVIDNQHLFWAEAAAGGHRDWERVGKKLHHGENAPVVPIPRLLEFTTKTKLQWSDYVSNSHSCPHNGVINWGYKEVFDDGTPKPAGYPGWTGRVEWIVEWPKEFSGIYLGSDLFSGRTFCTGRQRAHTGTGGGAGDHFNEKYQTHCQKPGYDFRIYAADWPGLARYHEKQLTWKALGGK